MDVDEPASRTCAMLELSQCDVGCVRLGDTLPGACCQLPASRDERLSGVRRSSKYPTHAHVWKTPQRWSWSDPKPGVD